MSWLTLVLLPGELHSKPPIQLDPKQKITMAARKKATKKKATKRKATKRKGAKKATKRKAK